MSIKIQIFKPSGELVSESNQYKSYRFDSQYGVTADDFNAVLVDNNSDIQTGYEVKFFIDGAIGFRGIIQKKERSYDKNNRIVTISGKDRSSILIEGYCTSFKDFSSQSPKNIIDNLINQTNFYTKKKSDTDTKSDSTGFNSSSDLSDINSAISSDAQENEFLNENSDKTIYDTDFKQLSNREHLKIDIGDKVWDKISQVVSTAGYEVLYQENGTLYIGDLEKKRLDENIVHEIICRYDGNGNNVLSCNEIDDISGRYSSISVYSTPEGNTGTISSIGTAKDSTVPVKKYMAVVSNNENDSPVKLARRLREEQRQDGYVLEYTVNGHVSENGKIWAVNQSCNVLDEIIEKNETFIIYGRTFIFSENEGTKTILRLGKIKNFKSDL